MRAHAAPTASARSTRAEALLLLRLHALANSRSPPRPRAAAYQPMQSPRSELELHHGTVCRSETCALHHGEVHAARGTQGRSHLVHLLPIHRYYRFPPAPLHIFCARSPRQRAARAERCAAQSAASLTTERALARPRQAVALIRCVAPPRIVPAQIGAASSAQTVSLPALQLLAPPPAAQPPAVHFFIFGQCVGTARPDLLVQMKGASSSENKNGDTEPVAHLLLLHQLLSPRGGALEGRLPCWIRATASRRRRTAPWSGRRHSRWLIAPA